MNLKKIMYLLTIGLMFTLLGCGTATTEPTSAKVDTVKPAETKDVDSQKVEIRKVNKLDTLKKAFSTEGLKVGENEVIAFQMLGANNGYKFKINDQLIEIYEYDLGNLTAEGKSFVEQAGNGSVSFSGFNMPVKYNNGLMLVRHDKHSEKDKILKVFNNFKS